VQRREFGTVVLANLASVLVAQACKKESSGATPESSGKSAATRIAVIPKGTTHEFWKSVHAGAVKASRELGVDVIWKGPLKEDDLKSQIDLVQSFTAQGVSGIALAPLNDKALVAAVRGAQRAGVPVVIFDSALSGDDFVSFVATDNQAAGRKAGQHMARLLGGKGRVIVLRYQEGSASTRAREDGFLEAVGQHREIQVESANQYAGATTESAHAASESLLLGTAAAKGNVNGIFTPNESTTFGMLLALEKAGLAGKIPFVGFDASEKLVAGVRAGHLAALIVQDPLHMGYLAVKTLRQHLLGQKVAKLSDTGSNLVTRATMDEPAIKALLAPDLERWLGEAG